MAPPELTVAEGPTIVFEDDVDWRENITKIVYFMVDEEDSETIGISVEVSSYDKSAGEIYLYEPTFTPDEIDFDSLPEGWDSEGLPVDFFVIYADGYEDGLAIWLLEG